MAHFSVIWNSTLGLFALYELFALSLSLSLLLTNLERREKKNLSVRKVYATRRDRGMKAESRSAPARHRRLLPRAWPTAFGRRRVSRMMH